MPKQPADSGFNRFEFRPGVSGFPRWRGTSRYADPSSISPNQLWLAENVRIRDGEIVSRPGQSKLSTSSTGTNPLGLYDMDTDIGTAGPVGPTIYVLDNVDNALHDSNFVTSVAIESVDAGTINYPDNTGTHGTMAFSTSGGYTIITEPGGWNIAYVGANGRGSFQTSGLADNSSAVFYFNSPSALKVATNSTTTPVAHNGLHGQPIAHLIANASNGARRLITRFDSTYVLVHPVNFIITDGAFDTHYYGGVGRYLDPFTGSWTIAFIVLNKSAPIAVNTLEDTYPAAIQFQYVSGDLVVRQDRFGTGVEDALYIGGTAVEPNYDDATVAFKNDVTKLQATNAWNKLYRFKRSTGLTTVASGLPNGRLLVREYRQFIMIAGLNYLAKLNSDDSITTVALPAGVGSYFFPTCMEVYKDKVYVGGMDLTPARELDGWTARSSWIVSYDGTSTAIANTFAAPGTLNSITFGDFEVFNGYLYYTHQTQRNSAGTEQDTRLGRFDGTTWSNSHNTASPFNSKNTNSSLLSSTNDLLYKRDGTGGIYKSAGTDTSSAFTLLHSDNTISTSETLLV